MFRCIELPSELFVIADVHGDFDSLVAALDLAPNNALILQLGDLVDRGSFSPLCVELMLNLVEEGRAMLVAGNHDVALADVVAGNRSPTPGRAETLEQFAAYSDELLASFVASVRSSPLCIRAGDYAFAHAAWSPKMETEQLWSDDLKRLALVGERRPVDGVRRPVTSHGWIDRVPRRRCVFVGHEVRSSDAPLKCENAKGGMAVFLDLGCGSGGPLGCAHIRDGEITLHSVRAGSA